MRIQSIHQNPLMPVQNPSPEILRPPRLPLQFQKLVQNLPLRRIQRPRQCPVQMRKRLAVGRQQPPQRLLIRRKAPRQRSRQRFHFHAPAQVLSPAHHIAKIQPIFLQQTRNRRLHQSKTGSRQNRRHPPQQMLVNHLRLRHISNFRRPADVSRSRQERVLHHRPQQYVRRKSFWRSRNRRAQFFQRKRRRPRVKFLAPPPQRLPHALDIVKKQRGFARHLHLRVKSSAFQLLRSPQQRIAERFRIINRPPVNSTRELVQPRIQRVQKNNSPPRHQPRHQLPERQAVGVSWRVRFAQSPRHFRGVRTFERIHRRHQRRGDPRAQRNFPHAMAFVRRISRQNKLRQARARGPRRMIDFRQVEVFRRQPKNRHGIHSAPRKLLRASRRRNRLVQAIGWPGKKSHLLPGNNGHSAIRQPLQVPRNRRVQRRRAAKFQILLAQHFHYASAHVRINFHFLRCRRDATNRRRVPVILPDAPKILQKCRK